MSFAVKRVTYRFLRFSRSLKYRLSRRITPAGLFILIALAVSALIGLDTRRSLAYQIFALLFACSSVSAVAGFFSPGRFSAKRRLPRYVTAGVSLTYELVIKNHTAKIQKGLQVQENLADPRPSFQEFIGTREPGEERRNILDRTFGAYRWQWLIGLRKKAEIPVRPLPPIPPGGEGVIKMEMTPLRRGRIRFHGVTLGRPGPLGLFKSLEILPAYETLISLPRRYPAPAVRLSGSRKYHPGGVAFSSDVGDSHEFIGLRDYRPGDPLRHIHWKSWARTGNPVVREFGEEYFSRHALILDTFAAPEGAEIFEEAVAVAASFAPRVEARDTLLDLMFVGDRAYCFTSGRSLSEPILEILAVVQAGVDQDFDGLSNAVLSRASLLSGCLCIFLSWDRERKTLVRRLRAYGIAPLVIVISGPGLPLFPDPGPMRDDPENFHVWTRDRIEEGTAGIAGATPV